MGFGSTAVNSVAKSHGRMGYFLGAISFRSPGLFSSDRRSSELSEVPNLFDNLFSSKVLVGGFLLINAR